MSANTFIYPDLYQDQNLNSVKQTSHWSPQSLIVLGNGILLASGLGIVLTVLVAYSFAEYFPIPIQIVAHIGTLLFAGTLKLGYIVQLSGKHHLQQKQRIRLGVDSLVGDIRA